MTATASPITHHVAPNADCGAATPCYATLQAAIDAAQSGDEIRVAQGVYTDVNARDYNLTYSQVVTQAMFIDKSLTVRGGYTITDWTTAQPITYPTVINPQGQGHGVLVTIPDFHTSIDVTLEGLEVVNGYAEGSGGGLYTYGGNIVVSGCRIDSNTGGSLAGGVYLNSDSVMLTQNRIAHNTGEYGVVVEMGVPVRLSDNHIVNNENGLLLWGNRVSMTKTVSDSTALTVTMVATYTYDGYGRRALKEVVDYEAQQLGSLMIIVPHVSRFTYLYDGLDIIGAQLEHNGVVTETYYYLAPSPITGLRRPFEMERLPNAETGFAGDRHWYQSDGLDSVVALTDESGDLASPFLYDEYGQMLAGTTELQVFAYTAQDYDVETGLYHFYARYYDARLGVWTKPDAYRKPIHAKFEFGSYSYVRQNPVTSYDMFGFRPEPTKNNSDVIEDWTGPRIILIIEIEVEISINVEVKSSEKCCGPDVTDWLVQQMNTNKDHPAIKTLREEKWALWIPGFNLGWIAAAMKTLKNW